MRTATRCARKGLRFGAVCGLLAGMTKFKCIFTRMVLWMAVESLAVFWIPDGFAAEADWKPLFNGKNLDGWTQKGGKAKYGVWDGAIVGMTVPRTQNSFLCTNRDYGDFVLELEFKVNPKMNAGIQIRSASIPTYRRGIVHGYQVEIDPSKRSWSGGIYDESRRGWIHDLKENEPARKAFRQNQWNHYRIEAVGDHIRTWINGILAADLRDSMSLSGFIALQVHGTRSGVPMEIAWRNLRIQDLGRHEWKPMFDGKTLAGWEPKPGGEWRVRGGILQGRSDKAERRHGLLLSRESFDDFTVRLQFKINRGDSGFYFRSEPVNHAVGVHGFQVELDTSYETGGLYETGGRGWVIQHPADKKTKWYKPGEWNELTVSAWGRRTVVRINGRKSAELVEKEGRMKGRFALQLHGGQDMNVEFKDIERLARVE